MSNVIRYNWITAKHFGKGRSKPIRSIILHATEGHKAGDLETLVGGDGRKVSVHWYVTKTGEYYHFVQDADTANHVGQVFDAKFSNSCSIGIEQEHVDNEEDWPDVQVTATANLCAFLRQKHGTLEIAYHKDVAKPHGRKSDPQGFPLDRFHEIMNEAMSHAWTAEEA